MALPTRVCLATSIPGPRGIIGADGADGADGMSSSTTLTAEFEMPEEVGGNTATVEDSSVFAMGQIVYLQGAGYMEVVSIPDATSVGLFNLKDGATGVYMDNIVNGTILPVGSKIVPAGAQGPAGSVGGVAVGGDLIGTLPNPSLKLTGTPGVYGDSTNVAQITTDAEGRVVSALDVPIAFPASGPPSGGAGGDLTGNYPGPQLVTSGVVAGTYGTITAWPIIDVDAKGRITQASVAAPGLLTRVGLLGSLIGAVFNTLDDQPISMVSNRFRITSIIATNPSMSFAAIAPSGGIYTGAAKTGNIIVPAAQTYTTLVTSVSWKALTLDAYPLANLIVPTTLNTIYFSLSVLVAAPPIPTADIFVFGEKYD